MTSWHAPGTTVHVCHACEAVLDDDADRVIAARELIEARYMGGSDIVEGRRVFFHVSCWPGDGAGYRFVAETTVYEAIRRST
jgi:hypothetical protein